MAKIGRHTPGADALCFQKRAEPEGLAYLEAWVGGVEQSRDKAEVQISTFAAGYF
jgi:hypothetical protein